jgi:hypothetical protein
MHRSKDIARHPAQADISRFALRIPPSIEPLGQMRCPRSFRNHEYDMVTTVNAEIARPAAKHSFHMRHSADLQKQSLQ